LEGERIRGVLRRRKRRRRRRTKRRSLVWRSLGRGFRCLYSRPKILMYYRNFRIIKMHTPVWPSGLKNRTVLANQKYRYRKSLPYLSSIDQSILLSKPIITLNTSLHETRTTSQAR